MLSLLLFGQLLLLVAGAKDDILEFINNKYIGKLLGEGVSEYEIVTPLRTDSLGNRIHRYQRSTDSHHPHHVYFNVDAFGNNYKLQLQKNSLLVDNEFNFTSRNEDGSVTYLNKENNHFCVYHGVHQTGSAALITCNGLFGLIRATEGDFFIQPLPEHLRKDTNSQDTQHVVYKRKDAGRKSCGIRDEGPTSSEVVDQLVEAFKKNPNTNFIDKNNKPIGGHPLGNHHSGPKNAASSDKITVETAVFVDKDMVDHWHKLYPKNSDQELLKYTFAMLNSIQLIYNQPHFIGKPVQFVLIKVEFFKTDKTGFEKTDYGDKLLDNFCEWQETQNAESDHDSKHWDHAFMFTGLDLKDDQGGSQIIGIAPLARMCTPRESCTLTESLYFVGVFTGAHEAGHNFGMPHDGDGNSCDQHKFIMAPLDEIGQNTWSTCSTSYAKKYLSIPWSLCLLDKREVIPKYDFTHDGQPGQIYSADEQCEMRIEGGLHDPQQPLEEICPQLKCKNKFGNELAQPAIEGSYCGPHKVCQFGKCVKTSSPLKPVNGGWGKWHENETCISGCVKDGSGLQITSRKCDHPRPNNGGEYCTGDSIKVKKCSDNSKCHKKQSVDDIGKGICGNPPERASKQYTVTGEYWQNFDDDTKGCKVWCEITGGQYITWDAHFPDGTNCANGKGSKYCLQGICAAIAEKENEEDKRMEPVILEFDNIQDNLVLTTLAGDPNDIHTDGIHNDEVSEPKRLGLDSFQDDIVLTTLAGDPNDIYTDGIHNDS